MKSKIYKLTPIAQEQKKKKKITNKQTKKNKNKKNQTSKRKTQNKTIKKRLENLDRHFSKMTYKRSTGT